MAIAAASENKSESVRSSNAPIVIDLGKQRRKTIKALRRGDGKLMDDISSALDELRTAGALQPQAQTVIVVVQQKRRRNKGLLPLL